MSYVYVIASENDFDFVISTISMAALKYAQQICGTVGKCKSFIRLHSGPACMGRAAKNTYS